MSVGAIPSTIPPAVSSSSFRTAWRSGSSFLPRTDRHQVRTFPSPICYYVTNYLLGSMNHNTYLLNVDREVSALWELEHLQQLDLMGTRNVTCAAVKELLERRSDQGLCEFFSAS